LGCKFGIAERVKSQSYFGEARLSKRGRGWDRIQRKEGATGGKGRRKARYKARILFGYAQIVEKINPARHNC